ncbi:MAG: heme exporter protein CcmD, partial [Bdellovibrionaceae bacterium]|nr:heme exporter protein CcmD [Pseudobdellovibrionaceae bacterium]
IGRREGTMDFDFGKYAEYMALGYAAMALILALMVAWLALRFRALRAQQEEIARLEAELAEERRTQASGGSSARAQRPATGTVASSDQ